LNTTAYLVVHLDTSVSPPRATRAGIYSSNAQALTGAISRKTFAVDITNANGLNYEDAVRQLKRTKERWFGALDWAFALLPEEQR
jgi:hypothetical protein